MHKFLLSCVMVFVLTAASFGQDWKGFYVGGNSGGVKGHSDAFTSTVFSPTGYFALSSVPAIAAVGHQTLSPSGFTGGGQAGYNFQTGATATAATNGCAKCSHCIHPSSRRIAYKRLYPPS